MPTLSQTKTNFTAGELSPDLAGRTDLRAYDNGAAALRNVFIQPTGGVSRRSGLRYLETATGPGRLVTFAFNTAQVYLLLFTDQTMAVYMNGVRVATIATPWTAAQLAAINWTQSADTLLVVHPEVPPQVITRTSHTAWTIGDWEYATVNGRPAIPWARFAPAQVTLYIAANSGNPFLYASELQTFQVGHVGTTFRVGAALATITSYQNNRKVFATVTGTYTSGTPTTDWAEQAFSTVRGWPASVTFHQNRLVIGGSRDMPNHLWLSRSGDFFNFDLGTGLADQAIDFALVSDQVNAIRQVVSGRHLQVFTTGAEWVVSGEPLAPTNIEVRRQTQVGSPGDRNVPPRAVEGATLFAAASGREVREFLYTDGEAAYQASDLGMLARHLIDQPADMDYDPVRRLLLVVMADGSLATVTNFRREQVIAWTRLETDGAVRSVAVCGGETYLLVQRGAAVFLEVFDDTLGTDAALTGTATTPKATWSGLAHLNGRTVKVKADGAEVDDAVVSGGAITLATPASSVEVGLPFTHRIEPLPAAPPTADGAVVGRQMRLVRAAFRLLATPVLKVDTGRGPTVLSFKRLGAAGVLDTPPPPFTGDAVVRALGWQRDAARPLWRVEQDTPMPCTILSVTTDMKVTE